MQVPDCIITTAVNPGGIFLLCRLCRTAIGSAGPGWCPWAENSSRQGSGQKKPWPWFRTVRLLLGEGLSASCFYFSVKLFGRGSPEGTWIWLLRALKVKTKTLKLIQYSTGSQYSLQRTGWTCSLCGILVRTHITAFWTSWSFCVNLKGSPAQGELQ